MSSNKEFKQISLKEELQSNIERKIGGAIAVVAVFSVLLHIIWSIHQQKVLENRFRDAIAQTLQYSIRKNDLIAIKSTLLGFNLTNQAVKICIKLPDGSPLQDDPTCLNLNFQKYPVPMSNKEFAVAIDLPAVDIMAFAGIPFVLATILILFLVVRYLRNFVLKMTNDLQSIFLKDQAKPIYFKELSDAQLKIEEGLKAQEERNQMKTQAELANRLRDIAHNLRAPSQALQSFLADLEFIKSKNDEINRAVSLVKGPASRILDFVNEINEETKALLKKTKGETLLVNNNFKQRFISSQFLPPLLETLILEKQGQYKGRTGINLNLKVDKTASESSSLIDSKEFLSVISNLIDNSMDALSEKGWIEVSVSTTSNSVIISIQDNGKGIPQDILLQLMNQPLTFGKGTKGTGIGLCHAKAAVHSWGGNIRIHSEEDIGTMVVIELPKAQAVGLSQNSPDCILLDDEQFIHNYWKSVADKNQKIVLSFHNPQDLFAEISKIDRKIPIYVDENLGFSLSGSNIAKRLYDLGFENLYLSTAMPAEFFGPMPWIKEVVGKAPPWAA